MISIVIPTYNEARSIRTLISGISEAMANRLHEVIIVDDCSADHTAAIARELSNRYPKSQITVIERRGHRRDLSQSVLAGFRVARGDILGMMDADISHSPKDIARICEPIISGAADLCVGSRLMRGGKVEDWPIHRKLMSGFAMLLSIGLPTHGVKDTMSGFMFFNRNVIDGIRLNPLGYKIGLEILVKGRINVAKEVPIIFRNRTVGKSKIRFTTIIDYLVHMARLYIYVLTANRAIVVKKGGMKR